VLARGGAAGVSGGSDGGGSNVSGGSGVDGNGGGRRVPLRIEAFGDLQNGRARRTTAVLPVVVQLNKMR
jgi:hypothetical protein